MHDALQCGFCTPGQIMSAAALIHCGREWRAVQLAEDIPAAGFDEVSVAASQFDSHRLLLEIDVSHGEEGRCETSHGGQLVDVAVLCAN